MESNIDPTEWRRETDRVEKLLGIAEYPEFLMSQSQSECSEVVVNHPVYQEGGDIITNLTQFEQYLSKMIQNKPAQSLSSISHVIENDLHTIKRFEVSISQSDQLRQKVYQYA